MWPQLVREGLKTSRQFLDEIQKFMIKYEFMTYCFHVYHMFDEMSIVY